jgi:hypothetical protein
MSAAARGILWWTVLVLPLWIAMTLCAHWEPVLRDGWPHVWWLRDHPVGLRMLYDLVEDCYLHANPRLGQPLAVLSYAPGPLHVIIAPVLELATFGLLTVHVLGRWPSVRRSDDAFAGALVTAIVVACTPQIGPMLFYRPFIANYVLGLAVNLLWLVPYRLEVAAPRPPRLWLAPVMAVLGFAAGLCNEHTGLGFLAMGLVAMIARVRMPAGPRGRLAVVWMVAGLVGLAAGYIVLLTAPAQHVRYNNLADQAGIIARIVDRGVVENLRLVVALGLALVWVLPLIALGLADGAPARSPMARRTSLVLALGGVVFTLTLLASPKIGPRLYMASVALIAAGLTGWLVAQLRRPWSRRIAGGLAAAALVYVLGQTLMIYRVVGPLGAIRLDRIQHGPRGGVITVPAYPYGVSRYFFGEDFTSDFVRDPVADGWGFTGIQLEPASSAP